LRADRSEQESRQLRMIGDLEEQVSACKKEAQLWASELEQRIDGLISVNEELRNLIHEERQVMLEEVNNLENQL
jgi:hypothetical protein